METSRRLNAVVVCALILGLCVAAPAKIIYVDDDAGIPGKGSSWVNAFTWLQYALNAAGPGDEIRVAQGFYRPDQGLPHTWGRSRGGDAKAGLGREATFSLKNGMTILGGFAGIGAEDPNARDTQRYQTVLTGDLSGNDVDLWGPGNPFYESMRADNSVHVVAGVNTDETAVLDGFVIEGALDAALLIQEGSPHIANCVFRKGTTPSRGGGLRCEGGQPVLSNCVFQENCSAKSQAGAIYVSGAHLTVSDCRFIGNWALLEGGAICGVESDLSLTGCTFEKNTALAGGAIHQTAGTLTLVECTFETNAANRGGAAAFAAEATSMTGCVFVRNWSNDWGGAIENAETPLTLDECTFSANTAGVGGAIYAGRLTSTRVSAGPGTTLTHCLLTANRAHSMGGALYSAYAEFTIVGCTFLGNEADVAGTLGWPNVGDQDVPYQLSMNNCIVWDGQRSIAVSPFPRRRPPSISDKETAHVTIDITYSDVQGGWPGEGNIDADPCFAAPGRWVDGTHPSNIVSTSFATAVWVDGDYHLKSQAGRWDPQVEAWMVDMTNSPCIDGGDPNSPFADEPAPNGGRINMGMYGGTAEASKSYSAAP